MIKFTQGDNAVLTLIAQNSAGNPINLTGATLQTTFRIADGLTITFPNGQHTINPDQVNYTGQFTLTLTQANTLAVPTGENKEIITQVTLGGNVTSYHGKNALTVLSAVPVK